MWLASSLLVAPGRLESLLQPVAAIDEPGPTGQAAACSQLALELPPVAVQCAPRPQPLVVLAGEGTTGTRSMAAALANLGMRVAHYDELWTCCQNNGPSAWVQDPTNVTLCARAVEGKPCRFLQETSHAGAKATPSSTLGASNLRYSALRDEVQRLSRSEYQAFDWCRFGEWDVVADTPLSSITPMLYSAFGPGTRVLVTQVNASKWAEDRTKRQTQSIGQSLSNAAPLAFMFSKDIDAAIKPGANNTFNQAVNYRESPMINQLAYLAERALITCTTRADDLLTVNVESQAAAQPDELWKSVAGFVGAQTTGLNLTVFPFVGNDGALSFTYYDEPIPLDPPSPDP